MEQLDKRKGFIDVSMNSFNHYAYGAISEWMYAAMAGQIGSETRL
jgi:alpha-L-rhamnosidase